MKTETQKLAKYERRHLVPQAAIGRPPALIPWVAREAAAPALLVAPDPVAPLVLAAHRLVAALQGCDQGHGYRLARAQMSSGRGLGQTPAFMARA
jgi:hypothetical protein